MQPPRTTRVLFNVGFAGPGGCFTAGEEADIDEAWAHKLQEGDRIKILGRRRQFNAAVETTAVDVGASTERRRVGGRFAKES